MVQPSWAFVIENTMTAMLVITYLGYEIRYGKGRVILDKLDGVILVVLAIAEENPDIDEQKAADRLNGETPDDYKAKEAD